MKTGGDKEDFSHSFSKISGNEVLMYMFPIMRLKKHPLRKRKTKALPALGDKHNRHRSLLKEQGGGNYCNSTTSGANIDH